MSAPHSPPKKGIYRVDPFTVSKGVSSNIGPSYTAQSHGPMPSPFVCLADWGCSCVWGSKLRTIVLREAFDGRGDRCEAAERTIHVQHVKETRSQTRSSQTGITLQCITYCNKEHSHQSTCSLYTGGNLADTGSLELPPWNPPASWSLPWALHVPSDHYAAAKLAHS